MNFVNAGIIAKNKGIVTESKELGSETYLTLITGKCCPKIKSLPLAALFGKGEIRIVEINGYEFDVTPHRTC